MRADLTAALRSLRSTPTFTAVALLVLTLGIGATTAIFSVVDAVVLRGLPFDEHDRLVAVGERRPQFFGSSDAAADPQRITRTSPQNYMDWAAQQQVFESFTAVADDSSTLLEPGGEPEDVIVARATSGMFDVFRVRPAIGRPFTVENEVDGRDRVAILSDALWQRRYGGDPGVIGGTLPLDGQLYEVIGVMPPGFTYPLGTARQTDLFVPYVVPASQRIRVPDQVNIYLQVVGRLKPGVTIEQAQAQMDRISEAVLAAHPVWSEGATAGVRPLHDHIVGAQTRSWMLMLLGAVAIVLLIACVNIATLLLARGSAREREVGVRAALGAGRWRLVRASLVESLVLSAIGTVLAGVLAFWAVQVLRNAMPDNVPRVSTIAVDLRVLAAAAAIAMGTGLVFGLVPAWQMSRPDLVHALKEGGRGTAGAGRHRVRNGLVVAEVALAVVLLVGAALFIGSFMTLMRIEPGFDPSNVLTARVFPRYEPGKPSPDDSAKYQEMVDLIGRDPRVVHASMIVGGMPMGNSMSATTLTVPGVTMNEDDTRVSSRRVTPEYHRALRIPLRSGRLFETTDHAGAAPVILVNEAVVKKFFDGQDPVGRAVTVNDASRTIVGVVGDIHQTTLESEPLEEIYLPLAQTGRGVGELIVRTSGDPYDVLPTVKAAVLQVFPHVPLRNVRTLEEVLSRRVAQRRLNMLLLGLFGLLGLVISAVGIYGVMAYMVSQRTREIGVRMALGATRGSVVGMVLRNAGLLVALGMVIGGATAWYLGAAARAFLFRVDATDPRAFAAAVGVLAVAALLASAIPARRASSVDPMIALRSE